MRIERAADAAELSAVARMIILATPYYCDQARAHYAAAYQPDALARRIGKDIVLVARSAEIIGFSAARDDGGGVYWLDWIGIVPGQRRTGIGESLLRRTLEEIAHAGGHKVWCDTRADNKESVPGLEKHGFRNCGVLKNHWFGQDYLLWEKTVKQNR